MSLPHAVRRGAPDAFGRPPAEHGGATRLGRPRATPHTALSRLVESRGLAHDHAPHRVELLGEHRLGEEVREVRPNSLESGGE